MNKQYQVVALIGKAGAGKDYLQSRTCAEFPEQFHKIVSCTTRPPRDNEVDGTDYQFLSVLDFTRKLLSGDMLEATEFRGWFYGTTLESLNSDKVNIGVFNPAGVEALLQSPELNVEVIYVDASDKTRLMRYLNRSENPDCAEMCRRYKTDEEDFADLNFEYHYIQNDTNDAHSLADYKEVCKVLDRMIRATKDSKLIKAVSSDDKDNNE